MKLSEAIRLGSFLKRQAFKVLFTNRNESCALGAACDATGSTVVGDDDESQHRLYVEYPFLHAPAKCPACGFFEGMRRRYNGDEYDLEDVIVHLNDDHKWTRLRIAEWVEKVEPPTLDRRIAVATDPEPARASEPSNA